MRSLVIFSILIFLFGVAYASDAELVERIKFAGADVAGEMLMQEDEFTRSWSQFDIDSRLGQKGGTKEELLEHVAEQALFWTEQEMTLVLKHVQSIQNSITEQGFKLNLPEEIYFLKTNGEEEGGAAGYTRANYIVLKDEMLMDESVESLIAHELFHVLSRHDPAFRAKMYSIIGFTIGEPIDYPDMIRDMRITNPDATQTDSYISLSVAGAGDEKADYMMVLYASREYEGGPFFNYLTIGFMRLDENHQPVLDEGEPVLLSFTEVAGFFEQVGKNTQYIIHPEEIMAENFKAAVLGTTKLPDQWVVDKIREKLTE